MRVFFGFCVFSFLLGSFYSAISQDFEISGKIIDAESKQAIPFANIALKEIYKGTASNALGEFSFKIDSLPVVLVISHLSYEPLEIEVKDTEPLTIALTPGKLLLDELVIKGQGSNNYAYNIVDRAYHEIASQYNKSQYGKAFYRQVSKNGDEYSELYEMFYDTRFGLNGVDDWAIQEGRYALKLSSADSFIYNKNFTLMVRLLTIIQPKTDDLIMPVSDQTREQYDLKLVQLLSVNNRKVAKIKFTKKEYIDLPAMEGDIFIDVESYRVLKINGVIANDNLNFITLKGEKGSWKNYQVSCEIAFKPLQEDNLVLDYIRLGQNFDYYFDGVFANKVETRSFLSYYEYYTPPSRKRLGGRLLRYNKRDADVLDNIGYNQSFWDENIIVKRTPVEAEVTASFEAERAFGSIYLNNKNQIILEDYEMDNDPFIIDVKQQLAKYFLPRHGEKVYLHHDKPFYVAGEKMWIKSYLVNMATNILSDENSVLHLNLISTDGEIVLNELLQIKSGVAHGQINIPDQLGSGEYIVIAYTDKMKNVDEELLYKEKLEIFNQKDIGGLYKRIKKDSANTLTFYPEGGHLIESMPMQIGYMAKNEFGEGIDVKGRLLDEDGKQIAAIKSEFDGLGSIFVMPKANYAYETMVMSHEINNVKFPEVIETGYSVMINNLKSNTVDLSVRGTMKLEGKKFYVLVISNGVLYDRRIGALTRGLFKAEFPKSNLPNGVSQILLVDEHGEILCKRLVFLNQPEDVIVKYYFAKKDFKPRERIDMVLELNDENGKSINGANISVSVLDKDKIFRDRNDSNIRSYFNFGFLADNEMSYHYDLFQDHERETMKKLDWLMLSQQTTFPEIESFATLETIDQMEMTIDNTFEITGKAILKNDNRPLSNGNITFISYPNTYDGIYYASTDENGNFNFHDAFFGDSTKVMVKANDRSGVLKEVEIRFDDKNLKERSVDLDVSLVDMPSYAIDYLEYKSETHQGTITGTAANKLESSGLNQYRDKLYGKPDFEVEIDEKSIKEPDVLELFTGRFPGINVSGKGEDIALRIRGKDGDPLILFDGIALNEYIIGFEKVQKDNFDSLTNNSIVEFLSKIMTTDISRIDVFKDSDYLSNNYGERAAYGIIAIFSKPDKNQFLKSKNNLLAINWLPGFNVPEIFNEPISANDSGVNRKHDSRATLYWNPEVKTNRRGRAKIGFYNSDEARTLQICVEGISDEGIPIFSIYEIGKNSNNEPVN